MRHQIRWTSEKIAQRIALIRPLVYRRHQPLPPFRYRKLPKPVPNLPWSWPEVQEGDVTIPWGSHWGEHEANFALWTRFEVPTGWDRGDPVALCLPIGKAGDFSHPEALAYIDGQPYAACDRHHQEIILPDRLLDGDVHTLVLHGWAGSLANDRQAKLLMRQCALVQIDKPTRELVALARVALNVADHLGVDDPTRGHLYTALDNAFKMADTREPFGPRFYASIPAAIEALLAGIQDSGPPLEVDITAVGHAHIDVAWLWTLAQTRCKAGRTFHSVIRLMEQFPTFRFTQSQPQLYEFVRQDYPELFETIQARVRQGQWEPIGGMWVEADCNLSGGESLARQLLLGRTYFRQHFGPQAESPVLWLPDVFGYAWNLPQLIKEAGLEFFFTIKIGWSQYNRLPYDTFWWEGLDGTKVLTHFSTTKDSGSAHASTYNAKASPEQILSTWRNFQQKDLGAPGSPPPLLMAYGYGDGGGGPTSEMVENIHLMQAFPAVPRTQPGQVGEFFARLEATVGDDLPTWNGELYLEFHRGTYTTQARNKRANRKSEFLLHDAEFLASQAALLDRSYSYPHQRFQHAWRLVCLNQFHDIIPGSSIGEVYADSQRQYAEVKTELEQVKREAFAVLAPAFGGDMLVVNPTSFSRRDLAFLPGDKGISPSLQSADEEVVTVQATAGGWLLDLGELPPYSITPLVDVGGPAHPAGQATELQVSPTRLENRFLLIELDDAGDLIRIYDKENHREVLPAGATANRFQLFEDRPRTPDAWEIDIFYDDKMWDAAPADSVQVVEKGPLRAALQVRRRMLNSELVQRISLAHNSRRIDFETVVQWHERHMMLKVAFPVDVLSPVATYEIQFGNVQRPTHRNTSWDWARFETCAQKWVDLSEGAYGVSLLNDCKYGHDIQDYTLRLTLLRSPTYPDPEADQGEHHFTYSLYPHVGGWDERTICQAYLLNDPMMVWRDQAGASAGGQPEMMAPLVQVDAPGIIVETVKQARDREGIILRLYESQRRRGTLTLQTGFPIQAAWRTNLLEENQEQLAVDGCTLQLAFKPYQIITLRILPVG